MKKDLVLKKIFISISNHKFLFAPLFIILIKDYFIYTINYCQNLSRKMKSDRDNNTLVNIQTSNKIYFTNIHQQKGIILSRLIYSKDHINCLFQ
jgi:hypothetical protein